MQQPGLATDINCVAYRISNRQKTSDDFKPDMSLWRVSSVPSAHAMRCAPGCRCKGDHQNLGDFLFSWLGKRMPATVTFPQSHLACTTTKTEYFPALTVLDFCGFTMLRPLSVSFTSLCDFSIPGQNPPAPPHRQTSSCYSLRLSGGLMACCLCLLACLLSENGPDEEGACLLVRGNVASVFCPSILRSCDPTPSHSVLKRPCQHR
jgi:hypothetical protein